MKKGVKFLNGQTLLVQLPQNSSVADLKKKIFQINAIPPDFQKIFFQGEEIKNQQAIFSKKFPINSQFILMKETKKPLKKKNIEERFLPQLGCNNIQNFSTDEQNYIFSRKEKFTGSRKEFMSKVFFLRRYQHDQNIFHVFGALLQASYEYERARFMTINWKCQSCEDEEEEYMEINFCRKMSGAKSHFFRQQRVFQRSLYRSFELFLLIQSFLDLNADDQKKQVYLSLIEKINETALKFLLKQRNYVVSAMQRCYRLIPFFTENDPELNGPEIECIISLSAEFDCAKLEVEKAFILCKRNYEATKAFIIQHKADKTIRSEKMLEEKRPWF